MAGIESDPRKYDLVKIMEELEQCKLDQTIEGLRYKSDHQWLGKGSTQYMWVEDNITKRQNEVSCLIVNQQISRILQAIDGS